MTNITAKYEIVFPFEIMLSEESDRLLEFSYQSIGKVIIHPPDLINNRSSVKGRFGASVHIDVVLDIDKKPINDDFDLWFFSKCAEIMTHYVATVWLHSKLTGIDPYVQPIYIKCQYLDDQGNAFINPVTNQSLYEKSIPQGLVLSKDEWINVGNSLISNEQIDLGEVLILNAKMMLSQNRFDMAIIVAAIACEYKVKASSTNIAMKKGVPKELWDVIVEKLKPRASQYFDDIMPSLGINPLKNSTDPNIKKLPSKLEALFSDRNKIVHFGTSAGYKGTTKSGLDMQSLATEHVQTAEQFIMYISSQEALIKQADV